MKKTLFRVFLLALIACSVYVAVEFNKTVIVVSNWGGADLRDIKIQTQNNNINVGTIPYGSSDLQYSNSKIVALPNKIGDSEIKMTYNNGKVWQGGYIENRDKVKIIYSDTDIHFEYIPLYKFLLMLY